MLDQALVTLDEFRGVFANNDEDVVPPNHFKDALNVAYGPGIFFTRPGTIVHLTISDVRRFVVYNIPGEDDRLLILNGSGQLFDSTHLVAPILTIATMTDFASVSIFGRAYISPHNGLSGLQDEVIYVYDGADATFVARPAAGTPPQGFELVLSLVTPTSPGNDIVAPVAPANGAQILTTSPYIPNLFVEIQLEVD